MIQQNIINEVEKYRQRNYPILSTSNFCNIYIAMYIGLNTTRWTFERCRAAHFKCTKFGKLKIEIDQNLQ